MAVADGGAQEDRRLRPEDVYRVQVVQEPVLSPDGRQVVYAVKAALREPNGQYGCLFVAALDGASPPHRLTRGTADDHAPRWSPDGERLAFLSTRAAEPELRQELGADGTGGAKDEAVREALGEDRPQVWVLDLARGGEPRQVTHCPEGVQEFAWSPDGSRLVIASRDPTPEQAAYLKELRTGKGAAVIRRTQHKRDGVGYLDEVQVHLFVVDVESRTVVRLTDGPCSERAPQWSPDGQSILFASNRTGDPDANRRTDLWLVATSGGAVRRLTRGDVAASEARFSPDGRHVAFLSPLAPEDGYGVAHLWRVAVADGLAVADLVGEVGRGWSDLGGVIPDPPVGDPVRHARRYPVPEDRTPKTDLTPTLDRPVRGPLVWLEDDTLLALCGDRGQTRLLRVEAATTRPQLSLPFPVGRDATLDGLDAAADRLAVIVDTPDRGREVYALGTADLVPGARPQPLRLSDASSRLRAERTLAPYLRLTFLNSEGQEIEAFAVPPPGFDPARPVAQPLLAAIHGGPMSYDAPAFRHDVQCWAAQGYLVLKVNYRGSTSYGEAFCRSIQGDWGPREHDDLMSGIDHLVRLGWADPARLFCTGFSYGGIMTNWAVGHTDRFAAAVTEHSVWDYTAAFGTDDCHLWWQDDVGLPWQNAEAYRRQSPSSAVDRIRTPLLITAGQEDWRCPLDQSEMLYVALRKRGVPTELVIYPGEHHAVSRPRRAIDRLRRIGAWLSRYGGPPLLAPTAVGEAPPA